MGLSNDERGWVMTCLSAIACVLGASIICIDILIRQFPGKAGFRIQDSDTFLSASLSLSFGVMLFSALYKMLPSSKRSLTEGGYSPKEASWILIACFLGGVLGIQVISRFLHQFIPSHVVDCEHTHEDEPKWHSHSGEHEHDHAHSEGEAESRPETPSSARRSSLPGHIFGPASGRRRASRQESYFSNWESTRANPSTEESERLTPYARRPSLHERATTMLSQLTRVTSVSNKHHCDSGGPCYGFSDPCGHECFKNVNARGGFRAPARQPSGLGRPSLSKNATMTTIRDETTPLLHPITEESHLREHPVKTPTRHHTTRDDVAQAPSDADDSSDTLDATTNGNATLHKATTTDTISSQTQPDIHHHHVPTNAFLSIGLQTSIAIALHKLPEGFITYATNHANPKLGVSVFLALFIHNITEGFAMALPLYLAINSRLKAMIISFFLGGLSQPMGAAIAAIWFKVAGHGNWAPSDAIYGGMFAVTAGIMASVALQLFSESLDLTHSRTLCMVGAFAGMGILGISSALTA